MNKSHRDLDAKLVKAYQSGNADALVALVKLWHQTFCEKAYWVVKDRDLAKDIAQDCWQVIIKNMISLKEANSFGGWALRIVYTKSIDALNARNKKLQMDIAIKNEQADIAADQPINDEKQKAVLLKAISELSVNQQMVIKLFYVQDYSLKQISELLKISEGTVKSRLFHARETLKKQLIKFKSQDI